MTGLHPVAAAYREVRRTGAPELPARRAAADLFRTIHPSWDYEAADRAAGTIVARAAQDTPALLWDGVRPPTGIPTK